MSDFVGGPERLRVYRLAQEFARATDDITRRVRMSRSLADQLERAANSVVLNIAEGAGHFSPGRKAAHYEIARASGYECIAILTRLETRRPTPAVRSARASANLICIMLTSLIRTQSTRNNPP